MDRILGFDTQFLIQLGWQLLNTFILFFGLTKLLFNPVRKFMESRTQNIQTQLETAEKEHTQAIDLKQQYENKIAGIQAEADDLLRDARKKAGEKEQQILGEAKKEAEAIKQRAKLDIEREQQRVKDDMRKEMIEVASMMAGKFVASSMDAAAQNRLLEQAIVDLGDVKWQN